MISFEMFVKITTCLVLLCTLWRGLNAADCSEICPDNYDPVCGTDGKTYQEFANACEMNLSSCKSKLSLATTHMDWCRTEHVGSLQNLKDKYRSLIDEKPECSRICGRMFQPMCVSNGKYRATAPNPCLYKKFNCAVEHQENFRVLREAAC